MKKKLLIASMFATMSLFAQNTQCVSMTKKGDRCLLTVNANDLCWRHNHEYKKAATVIATICTSNAKSGNSCRVKTKHSSGVCHHHRN